MKKWTTQMDAILTDHYSRNKYGGNADRCAAAQLGVKRSSVYRRAIELGLITSRERCRWTPEELDIVQKYCHLSPENIQRRLAHAGVTPLGIKRTRTAIIGQIHQNRFRTNSEGMNHGRLAEALGIADSTLHGWRMEGFIRSTGRKPSLRHSGPEIYLAAQWNYPLAEIRRFVFRFPMMIDLRKVNQLWFVELMRNGRDQAAIDKDIDALTRHSDKRGFSSLEDVTRDLRRTAAR